MTVFKLAHLSDPHLPPLPGLTLREFLGKRALGAVNWAKNRRVVHRRDTLDALVADMQAHAPDHIAVTGDLVNLALPQEFPPARRWLETLGSPDRVSVVPGNHDIYARDTATLFGRTFADFVRGDEEIADAQFPFLRRRGGVALIGVSTGVPTAPLSAKGWLGPAQRAALAALLATMERTQDFRVLLIHHPLRSANWHKRLTDAAELLDILRRHGVDLVLHGHDHVHSTIRIDGPRGSIPVVGVPSASATNDGRRPPAAYNLFSIARESGIWRCDQTVRGFNKSMRIETLAQARLV